MHQFKIEGRASIHNKAIDTLLFVDDKGHVIGYGSDFRAKGEFKPLALRAADQTTWVGFINTAEIFMPISLISKNHNFGQYCELTQITELSMAERSKLEPAISQPPEGF